MHFDHLSIHDHIIIVEESVSLWDRKRLKDIISHMRERIHGRIGNKSDNAFKLRKFAKMYDTSHSGLVSMKLCFCICMACF